MCRVIVRPSGHGGCAGRSSPTAAPTTSRRQQARQAQQRRLFSSSSALCVGACSLDGTWWGEKKGP